MVSDTLLALAALVGEAAMRFILRLVSMALLVAAIAVGTVDAIRSVSLSLVALTPVRDLALMAGDGGLAVMRLLEPATPRFWQPAARLFLDQPAFAVLLTVALLLFLASHRPAVARSAIGTLKRR